MQLQFPQELAAYLGSRCRGKDGARNLRRLVQTEVEGPLASYLLQSSRRLAKVRIRLEEGKIVI
jgi:ATP-dependent Clp protease ATP-binding subunit ClpA